MPQCGKALLLQNAFFWVYQYIYISVYLYYSILSGDYKLTRASGFRSAGMERL